MTIWKINFLSPADYCVHDLQPQYVGGGDWRFALNKQSNYFIIGVHC
jgi:hypothetical protein